MEAKDGGEGEEVGEEGFWSGMSTTDSAGTSAVQEDRGVCTTVQHFHEVKIKKKKAPLIFKLLSFCSNLFSYFQKGNNYLFLFSGTDVYTAAVSSMTSSGNKQYYSPYYGNLDYTSSSQGSRSWSPYYNNPSQYLEFQLSTQYFVTGFDTKGDAYSNSWVTKIKLLFYNDTSSTWVCTLTVYSISFRYYMKNQSRQIKV